MKKDAILLNGGRGSVLDCQALTDVLAEGHLWGAGLDVTDPEPLPPEHPLWHQPRALITPHAAGGDHLPDTARAIARIALRALRCYPGRSAHPQPGAVNTVWPVTSNTIDKRIDLSPCYPMWYGL